MYFICNTGDILTSVQVNIRTTPFLAKELDVIVKEGYFRNRTEAVNEAIRLLIRRYELSKIKASIESIREDTEKYPELSGVVESMREEEDGGGGCLHLQFCASGKISRTKTVTLKLEHGKNLIVATTI